MAWIFSLSIECSTNENAAKSICEHFEDLRISFVDGLFAIFKADIRNDSEKNYWVLVSSRNMKVGGEASPVLTEKKYTSEAGKQLYERLKTVSAPFRFALVGWEVDEFLTYSQLNKDDLAEGVMLGLVISEEVCECFGRPAHFVQFKDGYYWQAYKGEEMDY